MLHLDLTDPSTTRAQKKADVCGSRTDLINNGIQDPQSFAYPFGAYNADAEAIVQECGYLTSRAAGGISSSNTTPGPPWVETIPPGDPYAIRAIDVDSTADKQLSDMEDFITAAAIHGGGWVPMVFHQICDAGASDFSTCMSQIGVRDTVLDQFMTWLQHAGQPGGAPAGVTVKTVREVMNRGSDTTAPTTTIACNGSSCSPAYNSSVTATLSATDNNGGRGVDKTYYTTNGSTPTTASTVYTGPFTVSSTATVKFFSTDVAGNAEAVKSQLVQIDKTAPSAPSTTCNNTTCSTGWYKTSPVTVGLSATDSGGSGVAKIYYTTDGSAPTTASTVYSGPFTIAQTTTVRAIAVDAAGNKSSASSRAVRIDAAAPTVSITSPANGSTLHRGTTVTVFASATDLATGSGSPSGIASVTFFDGTKQLGTDTSSPYSISWTINNGVALGTHTLKAVATDAAGNSTTSATVTITVAA